MTSIRTRTVIVAVSWAAGGCGEPPLRGAEPPPGAVEVAARPAGTSRGIEGKRGVIEGGGPSGARAPVSLELTDPYTEVYREDRNTGEGLVPPRPPGTDAAIEARIERALFDSAFVHPDRIDVSVFEGAATLRGLVTSEAERQAAVRAAYAGGATSVVDDMHLAQAR